MELVLVRSAQLNLVLEDGGVQPLYSLFSVLGKTFFVSLWVE